MALSELLIQLEGHNGDWFTLHGPGAGDRGVYLGTSPDGLYDEPTEAIWDSHVYQLGASFGGIKVNKRDVVLGIEIIGNASGTWKENDSDFRRAWSYKKDSTLWIETADSRRALKLRLSETPRFAPETDPFKSSYGHVVYTCVAGFPRWVEDDYTYTWTAHNANDTGEVPVWNPTDTDVWLKYVVHATNNDIVYTLPDFSFGDDRYGAGAAHAKRTIKMPPLRKNEHVVVDTDEEAEQVVSDLDTQVWQRMQGVQFLYPLPAYTGTSAKPIMLPVGVTRGIPAESGVQVRVPRNWSRPWGLE